jgi:phage terminase small subunit
MRLEGAKKSGRPRLPTVILQARGSKRARLRKDHAGETPEGLPACPKWVSREARKHWDMVAQDLAALGLLTRLDLPAFGALCEALAEYLSVKDNPDSQVAGRREARKHVVQLAREFGMTPSSRASLATSAPPMRHDRPPHGNSTARKHDKTKYFSVPLPSMNGE